MKKRRQTAQRRKRGPLDAELKQLRHQLALVDLITEPRAAARGDLIELLLVRMQALKVKMYQEAGHRTPHVHIDYGPQHHVVASYSIDEPMRLAGLLDPKYDRVVLNWIAEHRDELLTLWNTMQWGKDLKGLLGELASDE
jgi:hypothetical protein